MDPGPEGYKSQIQPQPVGFVEEKGDPNICSWCKKKGNVTRVCSKCNNAFYCNRECQTLHQDTHHCEALQELSPQSLSKSGDQAVGDELLTKFEPFFTSHLQETKVKRDHFLGAVNLSAGVLFLIWDATQLEIMVISMICFTFSFIFFARGCRSCTQVEVGYGYDNNNEDKAIVKKIYVRTISCCMLSCLFTEFCKSLCIKQSKPIPYFGTKDITVGVNHRRWSGDQGYDEYNVQLKINGADVHKITRLKNNRHLADNTASSVEVEIKTALQNKSVYHNKCCKLKC